jgi:thymidylate kinase
MRIHLEGLDLAGKTTVCKELQQRLPMAVVYHNTLVQNNHLYEVADSIRKAGKLPDEELGWFYLAALLSELDSYAPRMESRIQDSTILFRSLAFHRAAGRDALAARFEDLALRHPRFDMCFLLTCSRDVRLSRLEGRISRKNAANDDLLIRDDPARFFRMEDILKESTRDFCGIEIIDTGILEDPAARKELVDGMVSTAEAASATRQSESCSAVWQLAAKLAAKAHSGQLRRDGVTPYFSHSVRVAMTLATVFGVRDPDILAAGLAHDLIEDTTVDFDDLEEKCGTFVAQAVATLSKDKRQREDVREDDYHKKLASADWRIRLIKMADVYDNFFDSRESDLQQGSTLKNVEKVLHITSGDRYLEGCRRILASLLERK